MKSVTQCVEKGGLPDGWTSLGVAWLAEAHRRMGQDKHTATQGIARSDWHRRWAAFCEDIVETARGYSHRI